MISSVYSYLIVEEFPLKSFFSVECPHFMDLMTLSAMNDKQLTQRLGKLHVEINDTAIVKFVVNTMQ